MAKNLREKASHEVERAFENLQWVAHDCWHLASPYGNPNHSPKEVLEKLNEVQVLLGFAEAHLRKLIK